MPNMVELLNEHGVTLKFGQGYASEDVHALKVTYQGRSEVFAYHFRGQAPTEVQIFNSILSETCTYEQARSYEDWCMEYVFDPEEQSSQDAYREVEIQASRLKHILGDEYDTFVYGPSE